MPQPRRVWIICPLLVLVPTLGAAWLIDTATAALAADTGTWKATHFLPDALWFLGWLAVIVVAAVALVILVIIRGPHVSGPTPEQVERGQAVPWKTLRETRPVVVTSEVLSMPKPLTAEQQPGPVYVPPAAIGGPGVVVTPASDVTGTVTPLAFR